MNSKRLQRLIRFLRDDLAIPSTSIDLAVRHQPDSLNPTFRTLNCHMAK